MLKASDIAPGAFGGSKEEDDDLLEYDLGNLLAVDSEPLKPVKKGREAAMKAVAAVNVQKLVNKLFSLPARHTESGPTVELPAPTTTLPREKPVPRPKETTTWEKFAKEKGILNKKRSRMVWDEQYEEFRPRWGYKKANTQEQDWAIPVKESDDPYADPWEKMAVEKKDRVIKNKLNQLKNMSAAAKARGETKEMKAARLAVAQVSTASMGKFDNELPGEPKKKRQIGPRKKRLPVEKLDHKSRDLSVLRRVLGGSGEGEAGHEDGRVSTAPAEGVIPGRGSKKKRRGVHAKKGGKGKKK